MAEKSVDVSTKAGPPKTDDQAETGSGAAEQSSWKEDAEKGSNPQATSPKKPFLIAKGRPGLIKMKLNSQEPAKDKESKPVKRSAFAEAFNNDSSDEEEMPPEAKMRMRNIGRETPTAAGPNSFGKNTMGFCDRQKIIQRQLQDEMDKVASDK